MSKIFTKDEIVKLNLLLDETLDQADKSQLIACIKMLGTAVASLKIKYDADEASVPDMFKKLVEKIESQSDVDTFPEEVGLVMSKTVVECATAMAVTKQLKVES